MRICFIGDSFVNGTGDDACLGWTGRLCAAARRAGHDVTHYNLGIRRNTSSDIAARWWSEAEARLPDDVDGRLVFSFGVNDCTPEGAGSRVAQRQTLDNAYAILMAARDWLPTLMVGPLPVTGDAATNARIATLSEEFDVLCGALRVPYLPVFEAMSASSVWAAEARRGDGAHPSEAGYGALADFIAAWDGWRAWF